MDENLIFLIKFLSFILLIIITIILYILLYKKNKKLNIISESFVIEEIKKVFKLSLLEINTSEIIKYENSKNILFIPLKKKALIIIKAKVLLGFDFEKSKINYNIDEKKLNIEYLPEPEILSIETNYDFYHISKNLISRIKEDDLNVLLSEAKESIKNRILTEKNKTLCYQILESGLKNLASIFEIDIKFKNLIYIDK